MTGGTSPVRLRRLHGVPEPSATVRCAAPTASMYLDQRGDVRACCQNSDFPLGNIANQSLREIWHGDRARRLRAVVGAGDLSLGCSFCDWQTLDGTGEAAFARSFDHLRVESVEPVWPQQLELSMSNACNLQCVMCNGEWSSAIRAHRERLPPLPTVYDDAFFDELAEFLPHLDVVKFLGGEPFLGAESLRVLDMLAELDTGVQVHITTNGTQWTPRIQRILERLRVFIVVSLDAAHPDTYESIRVGASFERVVDNIGRFIDYTRARGGDVSLAHCLMTSNWHEFHDFLQFAEVRELDVVVNTVTEPYRSSLYHLRPGQLREVVDELRSCDDAVSQQLTGRRLAVWREQLDRLGRHLVLLERCQPPDYIAKRREQGFAWLAPPERAELAASAMDHLSRGRRGWMVECGADGRLVARSQIGAPEVLDDRLQALLVTGTRLPGHLTGSDPASSVRPVEDLEVFDTTLPEAPGHRLAVARVAVRDLDGVLSGVRTMLSVGPWEESLLASWTRSSGAGLAPGLTALAAARALAVAADDVDGLLVGSDGCIERLLGSSSSFFGVGGSHLEGGPSSQLITALERTLGVATGGLVHLPDTDPPVDHHLQRLVRDDGTEVELHGFAEQVGDAHYVWFARVDVAQQPDG